MNGVIDKVIGQIKVQINILLDELIDKSVVNKHEVEKVLLTKLQLVKELQQYKVRDITVTLTDDQLTKLTNSITQHTINYKTGNITRTDTYSNKMELSDDSIRKIAELIKQGVIR